MSGESWSGISTLLSQVPRSPAGNLHILVVLHPPLLCLVLAQYAFLGPWVTHSLCQEHRESPVARAPLLSPTTVSIWDHLGSEAGVHVWFLGCLMALASRPPFPPPSWINDIISQSLASECVGCEALWVQMLFLCTLFLVCGKKASTSRLFPESSNPRLGSVQRAQSYQIFSDPIDS